MPSSGCRLAQFVGPPSFLPLPLPSALPHFPPHHFHRSSVSSSSSSSSFSFSPSSSAAAVSYLQSPPSKDTKTKESKQKLPKNGKKSKFGSKLVTSPLKVKQRKGGAEKKFGGKKPHQVARRNERERKRVQKLNNEYEALAGKLIVKCQEFFGKKLTKAQTLKAAILYIRYLECILSSERGAMDGTNGARMAEEEFRRQCLAMIAAKDEETADDDQEEEEEQKEADQQQKHQQTEQQGPTHVNGIDHSSLFPCSDQPFSSSSDHSSAPFPCSSDHSSLPFSSSSDQLSSFSSSSSSSDHLSSFSCASTPSFSPSLCYPRASFHHFPPPAPPSHSLFPSSVFSFSSSVPFQNYLSKIPKF